MSTADYPIQVQIAARPARFERSGLFLRILATIAIGWTGAGTVIYILPLVSAILTWRRRDGQSFQDAYGADYDKFFGFWVGFEAWRTFAAADVPSWPNEAKSKRIQNSSFTIAYQTPSVGGALLRYLTIIPHAVFYWLLSIVLFFAFLVAFVTVLVSESIPGWVQSLFRGNVAYQARTMGYYMALVDQYPPFSLQEPPDYHPPAA
jgi:hypothetical protein